MTLSNSRQQFLAYESQGGNDDIQYGRKGGYFVSTCVCAAYIILAILVAVIVGVIVYFITYFKLSHNQADFWNESEPFGQDIPPSPDLRLPSHVVPSFYRLKIKADVINANFTGEVYISIKSSKYVKEIILHSKNLNINRNAKLTEQIYEKLDTLHSSLKTKRDVGNEVQNNMLDNVTVPNNLSSEVTTNMPDTTLNESNTIPLNNTMPNYTITVPVNQNNTTQSPPSSVNTEVTHSSVRNIRIVAITEKPGDQLVLSLESALKPGVDYTLELSFEGTISNSMTGFYRSSYGNEESKYLGVTQFEPTSARSAFPCFDEPAFKAMFEISIAHPQEINVLSNMKIATSENIVEEPGWKWTHFERSVNMSTYLVAYVLCDFAYVETSYLSKDNITKPIRVWARSDIISNANYALTITPKLLRFYEDVFGVPYALDKIDLIAIPDFSNGAMENWGLITFRETALLYDDNIGIPREKQNVAIDIAHELAHQWFGNLVTMKWWTDLWLNEGFATYVEYLGVDFIEPQWNMLESFTQEKMQLLRVDALKNTSPVSRRVVDASEIAQKFDEISYAKGASLIRMLNHTLTKDLFHKGLLIYLNQWKFSNADEKDLWQAMSTATMSDPLFNDLSVVDFMNTWTKQSGYPVVSVKRNYDTGDVIFEQKLFSVAKDPYQKMLNQLWHIPICYASINNSTSEYTTKPQIWLKDKTVSSNTMTKTADPLYVNVDAIGYYRVNYDIRNWELLNRALKSDNIKSAVTRAQLIDDAFNLAKTSQLEYSYALSLTSYIIQGEPSKTVWELLLNNLGFIEFNLRTTSGYRYLQDYVKILIKKQLETLNYGLMKPKDDNEAFLIENLVNWECLMESERCLNWAREQFDNWYNQTDVNNNPIPSLFRSLVYNMALKHGGRREFEFLEKVFRESTDPNVKSTIITSLPTTRVDSLIILLLENSLSEIPKQYAVAAWGVESGGARVAQDFLEENFDRIYNKFSELDTFMFQGVLNGAYGSITTEYELQKLKNLALRYKEKLMPLSQTIQKLVDSANLKINWIKQHATAINLWFKSYVTGNKSLNAENVNKHPDFTPPNELPVPSSNEANITSQVTNITSNIAADNSGNVTANNNSNVADNSSNITAGNSSNIEANNKLNVPINNTSNIEEDKKSNDPINNKAIVSNNSSLDATNNNNTANNAVFTDDAASKTKNLVPNGEPNIPNNNVDASNSSNVGPDINGNNVAETNGNIFDNKTFT